MANFDEKTINLIWEKAMIDPNNDPNMFRKDYAGAWIRRDKYGDRSAKYGWEIDHVMPVSKGGTDAIENLLPLHWRNNDKKNDNYPQWETNMSSEGNQNVEKLKKWYVKQ